VTVKWQVLKIFDDGRKVGLIISDKELVVFMLIGTDTDKYVYENTINYIT